MVTTDVKTGPELASEGPIQVSPAAQLAAQKPQSMSENWPDLLRRIQATGARDEIQRLLEQFLILAEQDHEGMEYILELFRRAMNEWEDEVLGRPAEQPRPVLRLVTDDEPQP